MAKISAHLTFLLLLLSANYLSAQASLGNYVSSSETANSIMVQASNGTIVIEAYTSKMIKVSIVPTGTVNPDTSYSVIGQATYYSSPVLTNNSGSISYSTDSVTVIIQKNPVRLQFVYNNDTLLQDADGLISYGGGQYGVNFQLQPQEQIFGSGSRAIDINRRGQTLDLYNTAVGEYGYGTSPLNINIPFITSSNLYGIYFDNYSEGMLDIGNTNNNVLSYTSASGAFSYYFIAGNSYADILDSYTGLTGRQPLPPRWALGYIQSKYGYQSRQEAEDIVTKMQQAGFPMDAIVLDLYWYGGANQMGNLNWDNNAFPNPQSMMSSFNSKGVKTILIAEPYFTQQSSTYNDADNQSLFATDNQNYTYVLNNFWAGSAALLDIFKPAAQQWMWNFYKARTDEGVGGWWSDLGEPESHPSDMNHVLGPAPTVHNVYNLFWQQMLYDNYATTYPNTRLFNLSRSGYAGMQRYGATPWSGDVDRSFSGLQAQIPIMLGMGMSGESYMHSDLGGFCCAGEDDELYTRWFEYGTFSPIMRAHGTQAPVEPVNYPANTQNILHTYANLRYQLLPYNYSLAYQNSTTGIPQAKQLDFYDPNNTRLSNVNDEFYWGDNFLVAPVIQQGATSRNVLFPPGNWINFWNNTIYKGTLFTSVSAPLNTLPLFVRSGSFIPMAPVEMTTANYHADTLYVNYYADSIYPVSSFTMYDDDGQTPNANLKNQYALIQFNGNVQPGETDINLAQTGNGYTGMPANRQMTFRVQPTSKVPLQVLKDGVLLPVTMSMNDFNNNESAYYLDVNAHILYIHFNWNENFSLVRIIYDANSGITNLAGNEIKIYPNPVAKVLTIQSSNCNTATSPFIYDISGRIVIHPVTTGANPCLQTIDVSSLAQGVYLLEMKSGGESYYAKFVKQ